MRGLFPGGVPMRVRTAIFRTKMQPEIPRRWITRSEPVLSDNFDDASLLQTPSVHAHTQQIDSQMNESKRMSFQAADNKWIDRVLTPRVRLSQDSTQRALRQSIYTGDMAHVEKAYIAFRESSLNLQSLTATDSAHSALVSAPSSRVQSLLIAREQLSLYLTEPAQHVMAAIDQDLRHMWLPMMTCNTAIELRTVVPRLARLDFLDEAAAILTRYARGQGLSSDPELLRQAAIDSTLWRPILNRHLRLRSPPEKISKLLLRATGLGLPVDRMLCEQIIQHYLTCQPYPHQELATCFDLMSDNQVEFEEGTHGLKLLWMLKTGSKKTDIDELVRIIKQSGGLDSLHPPSLNALVIYEARRGNWHEVQRYLERIRSKGVSLEYEALLALKGFPELDLAPSSTTISKRDDDRDHSRALTWWLKVQQCLQNTESGLDDRVKQAVAICSDAQEHLEPLGLISVLQPVLVLTSLNKTMVDLSMARTALVTGIYDKLVWPDPRILQQPSHKVNVANMIQRFLHIFVEMGDMDRFTLLCIQASMLQVRLPSRRLHSLFNQILKRRPSWEEAAAYYEQLQLLHSDGEVYACLRDILYIPGNSDRPYPSAKFFGRLVKNCNYNQKRRLLKTLLRCYVDFLRTNVAFEWRETIPGHQANIGAQVRSLHAMVPEEHGWDDFVERQLHTLLMTVYFFTDQFDEAVALWKAFPEERRFDRSVISSFIDGCGRHFKVRIAEEAWDELRARRQPTANEWGAWLECLCRHSKASFERARDILLFEMGTGGGSADVPSADAGLVRTILSFSGKYNVLEDTKGIIKTHLPNVWLQLQAAMPIDLPSSRQQEKAMLLNATISLSSLSEENPHAGVERTPELGK
ncbi:hypothetical protein CALVIDRAFT_557751 [Calocera viscosa TUFC12733]|uniref:Uncharacterized protein n=1 Tax=Calocera viscosa (strain TUFC12733) TaxID=1330018 RepID=A0A167HWC6_CALVF|nr:hypothetical protein CALVIDRAFT_557751 [Calocera viscosa TUFC12733]